MTYWVSYERIMHIQKTLDKLMKMTQLWQT